MGMLLHRHNLDSTKEVVTEKSEVVAEVKETPTKGKKTTPKKAESK